MRGGGFVWNGALFSAAVTERREGGTGPQGIIACFFVFVSE